MTRTTRSLDPELGTPGGAVADERGADSGRRKVAARSSKRVLFNDMMRVLALVLDFDEGTKLFHAWRVAVLSRAIARHLPVDPHLLFHAGLVHDLGGIGMSDHVVHHAVRGFVGEARAHAARGARVLRPLLALRPLASVVAHHHERWDGKGFPEGLAGAQIPVGSSIILLADQLDFRLRELPDGERAERAVQLARAARGTSCPPEVAEAAIRALAGDPALVRDLFDDEALERRVRAVDAEPAGLEQVTDLELLAQLLWVLARVVDTKNAYTMGHSARVALYARHIAARLGSTVDPWDVVWAGLLHDVGMVAVPRGVLEKEDALTGDDRETIRAHARHTRELVGSIAPLSHLALAASSHHEAYDGTGYPNGLAGEAIPLVGRILAFADSYDALRSDRPHRPGVSHEEAIATMRGMVGTRLDPGLADVAFQGLSAQLDVHAASRDLLGFQQFFQSDDADIERVIGAEPAPSDGTEAARWHTLRLGPDGAVLAGRGALSALTDVASGAFADHFASRSRAKLEEELARVARGETIGTSHRTPSGVVLEIVLGRVDEGMVAHVRRASPGWRSMRELALVHRNFLLSSEAVCFTDADARIIDVNHAFTRMFGWRADEVIGRTPKFLQSGRHPGSLYREMRESLADPQIGAWSGELVDRTKTGDVVVVQLTVNAVRDPSGRIVGYVSNALDVTARRRAQEALEERERELLETNAALSRLNQFKSQMVAITSHDLRAPLASMIALSELLQEAGDRVDPAQARAQLGLIADIGHRMVRLVNDLLDLDKCESGTLAIHPRRLSPVGLARAVAEAASVELGRPVLAAPGEDRLIVGDADRLEQALENLVGNALKLSPEPGTVEIGCDVRDPDWVRLWVADRGPGIPEAVREAIFDRYVQVDRGGPVPSRGAGVGLGLAIVRHVAELHRGRAFAENRPGGGCRFVLELPATAPADARPAALLVGPRGDDFDRAARVLTRGGLIVIHADRRTEARRRLAVEAPALVLVDARWAHDGLGEALRVARGRPGVHLCVFRQEEGPEPDHGFDWELVSPLMDLEIASIMRAALARAKERAK